MIRLFNAFRLLLSDFLSTIVFVAVLSFTDNIVLSVLAGIATGVGQVAIELLRGRKVAAMQWVSLALVIVLGTATILTNDLRFAMVKPSVGNFAIGLVMLAPNWMGRYLPPVVTQNVSPRALIAWGYIWAAFEFALAGVNLWVGFALGKDIWIKYTAFVPITLSILLFLLQYAWLRFAVIRSMKAKGAALPA
jgi:intracellular septation protein A